MTANEHKQVALKRSLPSIGLTDAEKKTQARRKLAAVYLRDSNYQGSSWRFRADCACDAVYLYALAVLGADADGYEHPDANALLDAAERLGWPAAKMTPAIVQLERRYDPSIRPEVAQAAYGELISLAKELGANHDNSLPTDQGDA